MGEHFIHGLLHDIGKIVMNINFKEKYAKVIDEVTSTGKSLEESRAFNLRVYSLWNRRLCGKDMASACRNSGSA